jgi:hypothetical protein
VELIRAALGHHVDDGPSGVSELGAEEVGLHLELLNHVHGGIELHFRDSAILFDAGDRPPVQHDF